MSAGFLLQYIYNDAALSALRENLQKQRGPVAVFSLPEMARPPVVAALYKETVLYVTATEQEAQHFHAELMTFAPDALLYLPRDLPLTHVRAVSPERGAGRLLALSRLLLGLPTLIVTCAAALCEALPPAAALRAAQCSITRGQEIAPQALAQKLSLAGYVREDLAESPGQYARRGDLLDVFPMQDESPVRIEFFGDEVDQIRRFDPLTQRATEQVASAVFTPAAEIPQTPELTRKALKSLGNAQGFAAQREAWEAGLCAPGAEILLPLLYPQTETLAAYLPESAQVLYAEPQRVLDEAKTAFTLHAETVAAMLDRSEGHPAQAQLIRDPNALLHQMRAPRAAALYPLFRTGALLQHHSQAQFDAQSPGIYVDDIPALARELLARKQNKDAVLLFCGDALTRVAEQLQNYEIPFAQADALTRPPVRGEILLLGETLLRGFCFPQAKLYVWSQAELFQKTVRRGKEQKRREGLTELSDLTPGDIVVHESHGIGRFVGVEQVTTPDPDGGKTTRDYLHLAYRGTDRLYIPVEQLDRIQKYIGGGEDFEPSLSRLGGNEWQSRVKKAREAAKKLAVDLAAIYAARASRGGHAFAPDTEWQAKLEESFPYTETPDQLTAVQDVKKDMEASRPMDRLLCGDVGYGKTEVALRAAFKAIQDGKQVAVLVPTTVLARQHYGTFAARFAPYPVRVEQLSRLVASAKQKLIKQQLESGEVDLIIGTHALLSKEMKYKELGLIVIDEEHRFGVNHKEKLKELRETVDVLTLTATPIPRTLNLSLSGIRDISNMDTPPENRRPVQTFVTEYTDALLVTAMQRELGRGGQAFAVSNRVHLMDITKAHMQQLLPNARIAIAHGQMPPELLEEVMVDFLEGAYDILLCSTIIESGLDISNANTLFVLDAHRLGLAQLYQLRGRVGRSSRSAYAYFTVPESRAVTEDAQKRLLAIREFTQFGSGLRLAMRDLEIRGAGNLLGAEQHGHIADIGYEYYMKLMHEAVASAKGEAAPMETETQLTLPGEAYLPREAFPNELLRLAMYRRVARIASRADYDDLLDEYEDRYGDLPAPALALLKQALIRALAKQAGLSMVVQKGTMLSLQYSNSARPDGIKLLFAMQSCPRMKLLAGESPRIEIGVKRDEEALDLLLDILPALADANGGLP
ncbi:MAG: transcription-repair coupling factor [Clostridiales bacterium]|nr:transcription-repair coupling factor [Clostridiales bacterium]